MVWQESEIREHSRLQNEKLLNSQDRIIILLAELSVFLGCKECHTCPHIIIISPVSLLQEEALLVS